MCALVGYTYCFKYVAGHLNSLADYLSRHPTWDMHCNDSVMDDPQLVAMAEAHEHSVIILPVMQDVQTCALLDTEYQDILMCQRRVETKEVAAKTISRQ